MNSVSILLLFWHGLGDVIMATPAFREFSKKNPGCRLGIAVKKLVYDSGILDHCPYFDKIYTIPNVWESSSYRMGLKICLKEGERIQKLNGYKKLICIKQRPLWRYGIHKIYRTANELGIGAIKNTKTEVYIADKDRYQASKWLKDHGYEENNYIFLHRHTAYPVKDMPESEAALFLAQLPPIPVVEVGKTYSIQNRSINFSFALLEKARYIVVVDSVFLHAADALGKDISMAYFSIRPGIIDEVRPLNVRYKCKESYSGSLTILRKINYVCQKIIYKTFFKNLTEREKAC